MGQIYEDEEIIEVVVQGVDRLRCDPLTLRQVRIDTPPGGAVPLAEVADGHTVTAPNLIQLEGA